MDLTNDEAARHPRGSFLNSSARASSVSQVCLLSSSSSSSLPGCSCRSSCSTSWSSSSSSTHHHDPSFPSPPPLPPSGNHSAAHSPPTAVDPVYPNPSHPSPVTPSTSHPHAYSRPVRQGHFPALAVCQRGSRGWIGFRDGGHFERGWAVMLLEAEVVVVLLRDFWFWAGRRK